VTFFFGIRNVSASKETTASFALPFSGITITRIFKDLPNHPATSFLDEPGTTLTFSREIMAILQIDA